METALITPIVTGARTTLVPGASPAIVQNASSQPISYIVSAGTVSLIEFSRDGVTYDTLGVTAGQFNLNPSDQLRITYTVVPNVAVYGGP